MRRPRHFRALAITSCALLLSLVVSVAYAEATVTVQVRNQNGSPADGTVTLTPVTGGNHYSCQTHGGTCQIASVPGGMHTVTFAPTSGTAPASRTVMVAPNGNVSLIVSSGH